MRRPDHYSADGPFYWAPFRPAEALSVGQLVNRASVDYFRQDIFSGRERLVQCLEENSEEEGVVLILDPWTTLVPRWQALLREIDSAKVIHRAVVVVRSGDDRETMEAAQRLKDGIRFSLPITSNFRNELFCDDILSADTFTTSVAHVLERLKNIVVEHRAARKNIPGLPLPVLKPTGRAA